MWFYVYLIYLLVITHNIFILIFHGCYVGFHLTRFSYRFFFFLCTFVFFCFLVAVPVFLFFCHCVALDVPTQLSMKNVLSDYYGFRQALHSVIFHFGAQFGGTFFVVVDSISNFFLLTHINAWLLSSEKKTKETEKRNDEEG